MNSKIYTRLLLFIVSCLALSSCSWQSSAPLGGKTIINIGVAAPLEGSYTDLGRSIVNAVKLAVDDENNTGLNKFIFEVIVCNDKADTEIAKNCAEKFVQAKVAAVVGHLTSQASIAAAKIYAANHIVQISPASTHPSLTEDLNTRGYVFRTTARDDDQALLIAQQIKKLDLPHPLRIVIFNNGTLYGNSLAELIQVEVNRLQSDHVIASKSFEPEQKQYHQDVKDLTADVLVFVGEYADAAQVLRELALNNKKDIVFIGADGTFSQRLIHKAGLRAESIYVIGNTIDKDSKAYQEFLARFETRFKIYPTAFAVNAFDSTKLLIEAIKQSLITKKALSEELRTVRYHGLTGLIYFDKAGDPILPRMTVYKVLNGKFVVVDDELYSKVR